MGPSTEQTEHSTYILLALRLTEDRALRRSGHVDDCVGRENGLTTEIGGDRQSLTTSVRLGGLPRIVQNDLWEATLLDNEIVAGQSQQGDTPRRLRGKDEAHLVVPLIPEEEL